MAVQALDGWTYTMAVRRSSRNLQMRNPGDGLADVPFKDPWDDLYTMPLADSSEMSGMD